MEKPLFWLGSSRRDIRAFPPEARRVAGFQLLRVQQGLEPSDWKPMAIVGAGVREIRVHTEAEHRVCYVARFTEGIFEICWSGGGSRAMEKAKARVTRSSGNVFRDLGFGPEEAQHLLVRSELMLKIEKIVKDRGLTQAAAAGIMGVSQPRVSDLLRGKIGLFSTDSLIDMLAKLGVTVRVAFVPSRSRRVA
jgi:predicted XRE-type DNA-binding protein